MKNWIIPVVSLSAVLLLLIYCAENDYNFDNPFDKKGTNYLYGDTTNEQEKIGDINDNGIGDLLDPTYAITFNANGGTVSPASDTTRADGRLASLPTPSRNGYTFAGWYTAETGGQQVTTGTNGTEFKGDNAVYARWIDNTGPQSQTYTLTIAATAGGTVNPSVGAYTYDAGTSVPVTATADSGYTFKNWSGESSSTNPAINITMDGHKTLTANFQKNEPPPSSDSTFVDSRDGNIYRKVTIRTQTWMAENLDYDVPNVTSDVCYDNNDVNCEKYGRLYNWNTAMTACPAGWHLPSDAEWTTLVNYAGGASRAGTKLKSTTGWNSGGNGTDDFGWLALPGGYGDSDGRFSGAGSSGRWWSAAENSADYAWYRYMYYNIENVYRINVRKTNLYSVRCVED